ncbi:MAG: methyltransferase domain-containing protein [Solirubrobacterales bacterium]
MGEPIREEWVAAAVAGKSFAEVGGLWGTVNEQVTVAARAGATATTMIDAISSDHGDKDLWQAFRDRAASLGVTDMTCVQGSIDDAELVRRVGSFDVVSCSGVLYHCPQPLHTLRNLRAITRETLILGTATMPERVSSPAGTVTAEAGSALLVPAMTESQRAVLGEWLRQVGGAQALGVNAPLETEWALDDCNAWWWFFTRDYVSALLRLAGFRVETLASYWDGRATFYLAKAAGSPAVAA